MNTTAPFTAAPLTQALAKYQPRNPKPYPHRWHITYTATAQSPLSIGDGRSTSGRVQDPDEPGRVVWHNTVTRDADDRPYLAASGLKGALRNWARALLPLNPELNLVDLFGAEKGRDDTSERRPGFLDLHDAHLNPLQEGQSATFANLAHPDTTTQTYIDAATRIDRDTQTVADRLLFNQERVAPGAAFSGSFLLQHHDPEAGIKLVAQLLGLLNAASAPTQGGLPLGGDTGRGMGRVNFTNLQVSHFGPEQFTKWLSNGAQGTWRDGAEKATVLATVFTALQPVELKLHIQFTSRFLINEPSRTAKGEGDSSVAHTPRLDLSGKPVLPATSLHGALRAQAERILRTLGLDPGGAGGKAFDPSSPGGQLISALFGHTDRAAALEQAAPPRCTAPGALHTQDFIAIDRFTGGGKDGAKYNAQSVYCPAFEARLRLNAQRLNNALRDAHGENATLQAAARGLLLLTLRDLAEGDIPLGWGKRKGYGACEAKGPNGQDLIAAAADWLGQGASEALGSTDDWLQALRALRPQGAPTASLPADFAQKLTGASQGHAAQGTHGSRTTTTQAPPAADRFHNSYHFVPLEAPADLPAWVKRQAFRSKATQEDKQALGHHSHARYASQTRQTDGAPAAPVFSGRITCVLTAETPFIVGGQRTKNDDGPTTVHPYQLPDGQLAIPASSLKGLISSIAEAASGSSMRVFDDQQQLSYRKAMGDALSAVGMVVEKVINGEMMRCVQALGFPLVKVPNARVAEISPDNWFTSEELEGLHHNFNYVEPRVYVGNYRTKGNTQGQVISVTDDAHFLTPATKSYTASNANYHYLRPDALLYHWRKSRWTSLLLAQKAAHLHRRPLTEEQYQKVPEADKDKYLRGILRVLGRFGEDRASIPSNKKHELFLFYPEECEDIQDDSLNPSVYRISEAASARFLDLAKEANEREPYLPYAPQGTRPVGQGVTDLKVGDLVFFKLNEEKQVSELSFSMIWRDRVENQEKTRPLTLKNFLPRGAGSNSEELLPFSPSRQSVSPAELLLGFVELNENESRGVRQANQDSDQALAFAGKLRIHDALHQNTSPTPTQPSPPVTLKILAQPKLNDVLYFKKRNGSGFFRKKEMQESDFVLRGRKQYLHAYSHATADGTRNVNPLNQRGISDTNGKAPWNTHHPQDDLAQKNRVSLVPAGERFEFDIDFDNLSAIELETLLYALRPNPSFRHKLGMGKPIGLGTVRIDPKSLQITDRLSRYATQALSDPRTAETLALDGCELAALRRILLDGRVEPAKAARRALERLGDPDKVVAPVHSPLRAGQDAEKETYQWFTHNADTQHGPADNQRQTLPNDQGTCNALPLMRRH
jgi:CRISPR-associated protein (TIGR03986 family)